MNLEKDKKRPAWILVSTPPCAQTAAIDCVPIIIGFVAASLNRYSELP
jgi:hypothetical protein